MNEEVTFYEINDFKYYLEMEKRLSANTIISYITDLKKYSIFLIKYENVKDVSDISKNYIEKYILSLKRADFSKKTLARKITVIKEFHKFLHKEGITKDNPGEFIDLPKLDKHIPVVLSEEEIFKMLDSLKNDTPIEKRNKAMMETLYSSGLRITELIELKLSSLHLNTSYINVIGKGDKERMVPLGAEAVIALRDYIENGRKELQKLPNDLLFYNYKGEMITRQGFYKFIVNLAKEVGIEKTISPHTIRHSFATHLLENGLDLRMVQELLGHEDIKTTEIYTHIDKSNLKKTYLENHPKIRGEKDE